MSNKYYRCLHYWLNVPNLVWLVLSRLGTHTHSTRSNVHGCHCGPLWTALPSLTSSVACHLNLLLLPGGKDLCTQATQGTLFAGHIQFRCPTVPSLQMARLILMKDYQWKTIWPLFRIDKQICKVIVVFMQNEIEIKIDDLTLLFCHNPWKKWKQTW